MKSPCSTCGREVEIGHPNIEDDSHGGVFLARTDNRPTRFVCRECVQAIIDVERDRYSRSLKTSKHKASQINSIAALQNIDAQMRGSDDVAPLDDLMGPV